MALWVGRLHLSPVWANWTLLRFVIVSYVRPPLLKHDITTIAYLRAVNWMLKTSSASTPAMVLAYILEPLRHIKVAYTALLWRLPGGFAYVLP